MASRVTVWDLIIAGWPAGRDERQAVTPVKRRAI